MKHRRWIDILIEIKIRLDRGNALIYWVRNLIIMTAGIKYIINLNTIQSVFVGLIIAFVLYLLGWLDYNIIKFAQREAELMTGKYNNYFKKLKGKIEKFK